MIGKNARNRKEPAKADNVTTGVQPRLSRLLDLPSSAISKIPQIEVSGNREAIIEGCQGVLEYDESSIKLNAGKMSIHFTGRNLQIKVLTHDSAVVEGYITGILFT